MIVEDRAKKEKNKRLGSNHAVDLGEDDFFFGGLEIVSYFFVFLLFPLALPLTYSYVPGCPCS